MSSPFRVSEPGVALADRLIYRNYLSPGGRSSLYFLGLALRGQGLLFWFFLWFLFFARYSMMMESLPRYNRWWSYDGSTTRRPPVGVDHLQNVGARQRDSSTGRSAASATARSTARSAALTEDALSRHVALTEEAAATAFTATTSSARGSARGSALASARESARGGLTDRTNLGPRDESDAVAKLSAENRRLQHKLLKQQILLLEEKAKRAQDIIDDRRVARHRLKVVREKAVRVAEDPLEGTSNSDEAPAITVLNRQTRQNFAKQPPRKQLMKPKPFARNSSIMRLRERELQRALESYAF